MSMFSPVRSQGRPSAFLARRWCSGSPDKFVDKPRKFYSKVSVVETTNKNFAVKLDGREIKSKKFRQLRFDQYSMALAVASEFDVQKTHIRYETMPMYNLNCRAHDIIKGSEHETVNRAMLFLDTDTACIRADPDREAKLAEKENAALAPACSWFESQFGTLAVSRSIIAKPQPEDTICAVKNYLGTLTAVQLSALEIMVTNCKSLVLGLALFRQQLDADEAFKLSHLELQTQIDRWGLVEGEHDVSLKNIQMHLKSSSLVQSILNQ